jgi:hypothetical protein
MDDNLKRARALAEKITQKAEKALADLETEMNVMEWPSEFRVIMWDAVVETALRRSQAARINS